jgi:hypothetical protein
MSSWVASAEDERRYCFVCIPKTSNFLDFKCMYRQLRSDDCSKNIVLDGEKNVVLLRIFESDGYSDKCSKPERISTNWRRKYWHITYVYENSYESHTFFHEFADWLTRA